MVNQENFPQIPWGVFVQMQRAADEYERVSILAAWALQTTPEAVADLPARQVLEAFQRAMESVEPGPTMRQSGGSAGSP